MTDPGATDRAAQEFLQSAIRVRRKINRLRPAASAECDRERARQGAPSRAEAKRRARGFASARHEKPQEY